jgi:hypothetical protein
MRGALRKLSENRYSKARHRCAGKSDHHCPFGPSRIGGAPRPNPGDQRGGELTARDNPNHDGAETQPVMNMKRQNRKRGSNDQKAGQDGD